jgi:hypothetical protein
MQTLAFAQKGVGFSGHGWVLVQPSEGRSVMSANGSFVLADAGLVEHRARSPVTEQACSEVRAR